MDYNQLCNQYKNVPNELKSLKRWVCFKIEKKEDGSLGKFPINSINGRYAKTNDESTWSTFNIALLGCVKYKCEGIGFMLGDGIFGVDLDNHLNKETGKSELPQEEFDALVNEFVNGLNSYSEKSWSGNGIHIICAGKLPGTRRKTTCVEMYEKGRFFAFTGNVINSMPVEIREEEIKPLYEKYMPSEPIYEPKQNTYIPQNGIIKDLSLQEIIDKVSKSKNGLLFNYLYAGDIESAYRVSRGWKDNSHSSADMALCNLLAFWCNGDIGKMDAIFRSSGLMRPKWDEKRGENTYGEITLNVASRACRNGYTSYEYVEETRPKIEIGNKQVEINENTGEVNENIGEIIDKPISLNRECIMNIDENGEPIFRIKNIFKRFPCNDTGNAEKFYAYFGELFKYNKTDKIFMFWTGKTWIRDEKDIIRKYANKFIEICRADIKNLEEELERDRNEGKDIKLSESYIKAYQKNIDRISNKAGKDAMLSEFQSLRDIAVTNSEFNNDDYVINTDSGIIDLRTGNISNFDPKLMISKNTNVKVSYETPEVWIKFLHGIFERGNPQETEEIIECVQKALGYTLTGLTTEQCMFLMYGNGSNGKSTFIDAVFNIMGDYADNVKNEILMKQNNQTNNSFTIAKLKDARFVQTGETDEGEKLAEGTVKQMTGDTRLSACFKFANEFSFKPKFKIWLDTNNKPIIRGTDYGIWRRIYPFPFLHTFTEEEKDKDLSEKLKAEADKILGWCIKGAIIYLKDKSIKRPQCLEDEIKEYRDQMDVVAQFINNECVVSEGNQVSCRLLYKSYKSWCVDNGAFLMSEMKFSKELIKKGHKIKFINGTKYYDKLMHLVDYGR